MMRHGNTGPDEIGANHSALVSTLHAEARHSPGVRLSFLGAAGTVTGSRYLLRAGQGSVLVDCGLFQGVKQLRLRNWAPFPVGPDTIDAVVLTHAHLDHSGYLPVLRRNGFRGPIYCTPATLDLAAILLLDSARLQEEDARFANRHGFSKHRPALPLYTEEDVHAVLEQCRAVPFGDVLPVGDIDLTFRRAGHILGAASARLRLEKLSVFFSGDVGQPTDPIIHAPEPPADSDYIVVESTYGDRHHLNGDVEATLAAAIRRTAARGGVTMIPAFAVGRTQLLLHYLARLRADGAIPDIPVFLDSPLGEAATRILWSRIGEHQLTPKQIAAMEAATNVVRNVNESKAIDARRGPMVIVAGAGMITGGRILHHLKRFGGDHRNLILLTGFQAPGTRGAALIAGARELKIHGSYCPINAEVAQLPGISAHADATQIVNWLKPLSKPKHCYITHGEPTAADALRLRLTEQLGWACSAPDHLAQVNLV